MTVRRDRGFTLIEIMVVVLIIGLIVAMAMPNALHSRSFSRYRVIRANLQQLDSAKMQWAMATGQANGAACPMANLVPVYLSKRPMGPLDNNYSPNAVGVDPMYDGKVADTWAANCEPDPTAAACGL